MASLLLAILSSAAVSLVMRASEGRVRNDACMLAANYLMCAALAGAFSGLPRLDAPGFPFALGLGAANGALYLLSFLLLQWNVRENGVVLPATFMKLGVLVPTALAVAAFGERLSAVQAAGFALAVLAVVMIRGEKGDRRAKSAAGLVALLLGGGAADAASKVYEELGNPALREAFLLFTFLFALLLCAGLCRARGQRPRPADVAFGLLIGVPNYFSARFLLLALRDVPAVIAYPTFSVGTIVLVTAAGAALFGERLSRRQTAAMGVILAALAMLHT